MAEPRPPRRQPRRQLGRGGTAARAGDAATGGGPGYVCLQAHTAQAGWEPPNVPALWRLR
ncbi:carbohydrate-binding protein [Streptomyces narbonensis]